MLKRFLNNVNEFDNLFLKVKQETLLHLDSCVQNENQYFIISGLVYDLSWLDTFGDFYDFHDRKDEAKELIKRALRVREEKQGLNHSHTLITAERLTEIHLMKDQFHKAEELLHRTIIARARKLGFEHTNIFATIKNLMNISKEQLEESNLLETLRKLMLLYAKKGRPNDAKMLLEIMSETGDINLNTLKNSREMASIASLMIKLDDRKHDEVEEHFRRKLMKHEEKLGLIHTAVSSKTLLLCQLAVELQHLKFSISKHFIVI